MTLGGARKKEFLVEGSQPTHFRNIALTTGMTTLGDRLGSTPNSLRTPGLFFFFNLSNHLCYTLCDGQHQWLLRYLDHFSQQLSSIVSKIYFEISSGLEVNYYLLVCACS